MNRSFWITLVVSVAVSILAVMVQATRSKSLAQRLADEEAKAAPREERRPARPDAFDPGPSRERIERALAELETLVPDSPGVEEGDSTVVLPTTLPKDSLSREDTIYRKRFLDFLRSVDDLGVDELVAVAGKTSDPTFRKWLLLLAAEHDPIRIYRNGEWKGRLSTGQMAEALAKVDPAAALGLFPPMKPRSPDDSPLSLYLISDSGMAARIRVVTKMLGSDVGQGLRAFLEIQENLADANYRRIPMGGLVGSFGIPRLPEESVPELIEAMGRTEYAPIRDDLIKMTLTHTMFEGGVPAVVQRAGSMQLTPAELKDVTGQLKRLGGLENDGVAMIDWISEVLPGEVPSTLVDWAELDLPAATDWLGGQEPSPMRDQAIAKFARESSELDKEGAAAWAREIQDENMRTRTLRQIGNR